MEKKTTGTLTSVLKSTKPSDLKEYLDKEADSLIDTEKPFAAYLRSLIRRNGLTQQEVFVAADMSDSYGYKIVGEEKRTKQRDTILRLCFASRLTLEETQRALTLYGMGRLYPKFPRDAVLMVALNTKIHQIPDVNRLLEEHDMEPLYSGTAFE